MSTRDGCVLGGPLVLLRVEGAAVFVGVIWLAHIGLDRMLGYGLKYATGFGNTHLGVLGKPQRNAL